MGDGSETRESGGLRLPERWVPIPRLLSAEAQAFLASVPPVAQSGEPEDVTDKVAWRAHAVEANRGLLEFTKHRAERYPAKVTTHELSASSIYEITPDTLAADRESLVIVYVHGGGFIAGGGEAAYYSAMPLASLMRGRVFSIDYRMAPDNPFPAGLDDCVEAYEWLLARYPAEQIAFYGASAGGNLAPACIVAARDRGLPMPAACALHSPAADLTQSGDSFHTNHGLDIALHGGIERLSLVYADGCDLEDPLVSPLFADYGAGFPPTMITTGTRDLLLSSCVQLHRAMRRSGVAAELHVWDAMSHVLFFDAPEEEEVDNETVNFLLRHLSRQ